MQHVYPSSSDCALVDYFVFWVITQRELFETGVSGLGPRGTPESPVSNHLMQRNNTEDGRIFLNCGGNQRTRVVRWRFFQLLYTCGQEVANGQTANICTGPLFAQREQVLPYDQRLSNLPVVGAML